MSKVLLILLDGMRPDSITDIPQVQELKKTASWSMDAQTVFPSVTLPCHMSLFHSVDPERHGTTTNTYMPQVRPIKGLCEVLKANKKVNAFFYSWEELKDLSRPDSLSFACYCSGHTETYELADAHSVDILTDYIPKYQPDFTFLYFGLTDMAGHSYGWMSERYMSAMQESWEKAARAIACLPEDYTVIITADHGGHGRSHGSTMPEDMTIPIFFKGPDFKPGEELHGLNIKDIAPTITRLLGCEPDPEWEGKSLV